MPPRPNTESRGRDQRGSSARSRTVLTTVGGTQGCLLPGNECPVSSSPPKHQTFVYTEGPWHMGGVPPAASPPCAPGRSRFGSPPLPCGGGPKRPFRRVPRRGRTPGPNDAGEAVNPAPLSGVVGWTRRVGCGGSEGGAAQRPRLRCYGSELNRVGAKRCHQGRAPPSAVAWWWPCWAGCRGRRYGGGGPEKWLGSRPRRSLAGVRAAPTAHVHRPELAEAGGWGNPIRAASELAGGIGLAENGETPRP